MPSDKPKVVVYTDDITKYKINIIAEADNRKASNYIDILLRKHIKEYEQEHGEIEITDNHKN